MPGGAVMPRTVGVGHQDFEQMITKNNFYIDKTMFIKEWWENNDAVTLITRPRRFGKTLNLDMTECFFFCHLFREKRFVPKSVHLAGRKIPGTAGDLSGPFPEFCRGEGNLIL